MRRRVATSAVLLEDACRGILRGVLVVAGIGLAASATGCEPSTPARPSADRLEPSLRSLQSGLFDVSCTRPGCHGGASPESGLDLSSGRSHAHLVGVRSTQIIDLLLVSPHRPRESYLIRKLTGDQIVGESMPQGEEPLPDDVIDVVRRWIAAGAHDN